MGEIMAANAVRLIRAHMLLLKTATVFAAVSFLAQAAVAQSLSTVEAETLSVKDLADRLLPVGHPTIREVSRPTGIARGVSLLTLDLHSTAFISKQTGFCETTTFVFHFQPSSSSNPTEQRNYQAKVTSSEMASSFQRMIKSSCPNPAQLPYFRYSSAGQVSVTVKKLYQAVNLTPNGMCRLVDGVDTCNIVVNGNENLFKISSLQDFPCSERRDCTRTLASFYSNSLPSFSRYLVDFESSKGKSSVQVDGKSIFGKYSEIVVN